MDKLQVDLLKKKYSLDSPNKRGAFFFLRLFLVLLVVVAVSGVVFSYQITNSEDGTPSFSIFRSIKRLVRSADRGLTGEAGDRINFLLLGVGGEGHDGPELTDTMIFASFRPSNGEIGMLSIPRDLIVDVPGYDARKVNNVNALGEMERDGYGPPFVSEVIGKTLGQEIHYYVKVNFDGFAELIDEVGGIDVYVERSFTDYSYPTDDYLTQVVHFEEGWQKMDGDTALVFARSRHGNNGEGSDFARAARQQKILLALKDRLLSASTLLSPTRIGKLYDTMKDNVDTNITLFEAVRLASFLPDIDNEHIAHHVLDASPDSPLYETNLNGAYVLLPKNDDWTQVKRMAANVFFKTETDYAIEPPPGAAPHFVKIEIQNGTAIPGYAFAASHVLEEEGFDIVKIGNANSDGYEHTVIYDLSDGQNAEALQEIKDLFEANVSMTASGWIFTNEIVPTELTITESTGEEMATERDIDFLVILGENSANLVMR